MLPDGWERSEATNGIPYYINHETETTQWDHPEMISLLEEIESFSNIKYAAYRTAMKLRAIQKKTQLYLIDLRVIKASLAEEGIKDGYIEGNLSIAELSKIIMTIFINQTGDRNSDLIDVYLASELVLNWILNVHDPGRMGFVPILSLKVCLAVMCSGKVQEKYRYLFSQLCNNHGFLDGKRLKFFLQEMLQIPKYIYENAAFSGSSVEPAVRSCLEGVSIPERVSVEEFIEWMIAEPQTIVWLPTLHRLAVSETVKHETKCNVCKMYPIVGFRYRCLKCFNFDLCQSCFWSGRVSKQHKIGHPTQEYCLVSTQKEDIKDFAKVMRNKVSKKNKKKIPEHPSKGRFIPIEIEEATPSDGEDEFLDSVDAGSAVKVFPGTHDKLGSYAARLANHEAREEEISREEVPVITRTAIFTEEPEAMGPSPTEIASDLPVDSPERRDLEDLISTLENDNRALQSHINSIQQLQHQNQEEQNTVPIEDPTKEAYLRHQRERLEAREEVLEEHNYQLQVQLHRLTILLQQGDISLSSLKSIDQPASNPSANTNRNTRTRLKEVQNSLDVPRTALPPVVSQAIVPQNGTTVFPNTFKTPAAPVRVYPPQYLLPPGMTPPLTDAFPQRNANDFRGPSPSERATSLGGPFVTTTDAELGLLDRPDISYEGLQLSNIVDKMTATFPIEVSSDMQMDIHNELFLSASLVGEAVHTMVDTVAGNTAGATKRTVNPASRKTPDYAKLDDTVYDVWPQKRTLAE